jgi:DNA-binding CsgD family transcriptional regulator
MVAEHLHEQLSAYIKANMHKRDIDIALHFALSRQTVANFRNNILKLKKIRNYYHKDLNNLEARQRIGEALEVWVSSGYSSKAVTEKTGLTIHQITRYITQYYLPKRLTEQREVITLQSRI